MENNVGTAMTHVLNEYAKRNNGIGLKTGNYCNKHSKKVTKTRVTVTEIVDFNEDLGVYPVEMVMGPNKKEFCPVCRKKELEEKVYREKALPEKQRYDVKNTSHFLKSKSIIIDQSIKDATFDNFKVVDEVTNQLKLNGQSIVREVLNGSDKNYLFAGNVGTGKSHLAHAIAYQLNVESFKLGKPIKTVYISIPQMVTLIRHSYSLSSKALEDYKYKKNYFIELSRKCDFVVFDDLGAELGQVQRQDAAANDIIILLGEIFETRVKKPTIITTNLEPQQVRKMYDDRVESRVNDGFNKDAVIFAGTADKRKNRIMTE